ncbi:MAG: flagellar hook-length control protein FliK, partial [Clostridiales bacterium]|nr:flagellar hook-length control protein FliK [Clostridiales bacterium]
IVSLPEASPHMEISLKPEHLGKLIIDLRLGENGLTAKIVAANENVRNLLAAHIDRLSDTLTQRGINLENVEVVYTALSDKAFGQQQPEGQKARENSSRENARIKPAEALGSLPWENVYDLPLMEVDPDWGLSSVEYRA